MRMIIRINGLYLESANHINDGEFRIPLSKLNN